MVPEKKPLSPLASRQAIGERLKATREALGLRPMDICRATGIKPSAYSQYEAGQNRPNVEDMIRYAETFHVTLDWIYRGDPSGLPYGLARSLLKSE